MGYLVSLLIVTASTSAQTAAEYSDSSKVYSCDFEIDSDRNFDGWPDNWTRRAGRGFPHYLKIAIQKESRTEKNRALKITLDGGAATVYSPSTQISPRFSYVVETDIKTNGLKHNSAYISVLLLDSDGNPIETIVSKKFQKVRDWRRIRIGPITPHDANSANAIISLHLEPSGRKSDLDGYAQFDNVRLVRLPRMSLTSNHLHNVFVDPRDIEIKCEISGVLESDRKVKLELLDIHSNVVDANEQPLTTLLSARHGIGNTLTWRPHVKENGFYRVRAKMSGESDQSLHREVSFVVIDEFPIIESGDFGWSLPQGERPLSTKRLSGLLRHAGINWVKFPVWNGNFEVTWADRIAEFAERLSENKIQFIGVLDQPPREERKLFGNGEHVPVATIFVDPEMWQPVVGPVMSRLALYVRWWQIGADDDTSFVDFPDLNRRIREVKEHFEDFGQEIEIGIPWHWLHQSPKATKNDWEFLSLTESPSFSASELELYLKNDTNSTSRRWVSLKPLARSKFSLDVRVRDLVTRMLAAKIGGADSVFIPTPFDEEHGLMNPDGTPGELFLPWRTLALSIAGKEYLGSIRMPNGSKNHIFADDNNAVMIAWNDTPVDETIFLGFDIRQVDAWGRSTTTDRAGHRQIIKLDRIPIVITGLNRKVAEWRMNFQFDEKPLASVFGQPQSTSFRFQNTFGHGIGGRMELHAPTDWETQKEFDVKLPVDGKATRYFDIVLSSVARTGTQAVRADFELTADRSYRFSVYRNMQVGRGDVVINVETRINEKGALVVTQKLINHTDRFISFDCLLFAPNHRRQRIQVINLGRGGNSQTYYLPNGDDLVGKKLWLRAEEINGSRVLNYHVTVSK